VTTQAAKVAPFAACAAAGNEATIRKSAAPRRPQATFSDK
jgi:hypothetical protein